MKLTQTFHRIALTVLLMTLVFPIFASSTNAATQAQIDAAINDGLAWLANQQDLTLGPGYGSWNGPNDPTWTYFPVGVTGLAVLKFEHHALQMGLSPFDPDYQYSVNVQAGLDYLFNHSVIIPIAPQPAGDPDTDGDGNGVYFVTPLGDDRVYETSTVMMAIAASQAPDRIVAVAASPVNGWTYRDVLVDAVDYLVFAQTEGPTPSRGGWSYQENTGASDQSNAGYASLALGHAEAPPPCGFGLTVPAFVKTEMNFWIDYIQNDLGPPGDVNDGGSGYTNPDTWCNILKTGHLLYQMAFVGDIASTPRVRDAVDYMVRHWGAADYTPGWRGPGFGAIAHYQATYTTMKGLHTLGLDPIDGIYWQEEFSDVLVAEQSPAPRNWPNTPIFGWEDGSATEWDQNNVLSTIWVLLTLQKVVCIIPPPVGGVHVTANELGPLLLENALIIALSVAVIASAILTIMALKNRKKR